MLKRIEKSFELSISDMRGIMKRFQREMDMGLSLKQSSLKMIPTYVNMPTGSERGRFIALDLGGTNFRVLELTLKGARRAGTPSMMKFTLQKKHMTGSAGIFFAFIADSVRVFMKKHRIPDDAPVSLGFTFSFPIKQTSIASGTLICWTKGFEVTGVVGKDVVDLMNKAFVKKGIKNITISALVNDTVGTLVARSYEDPECSVGVIIGTGTNACYPEPARDGMIINIEWGNFNKLPRTSYDRRLDGDSDNQGCQILEKMVSGMYMGEIVRLILKDLGIIFKKGAFETEYMSLVEADTTSDLRRVKALLDKLGHGVTSVKDRQVFKKVCRIVSRRSARISASCIAAIVTRIDPKICDSHTIAIDGSVFEKHPTFAKNMKEALVELLAGKARRIKPVLAKDGSGKGAAIIAAVAANR